MTSSTAAPGSGDGTRPATDGGVDNIGGGEKFSDKRDTYGERNAGPAPQERMTDRRKNAESAAKDDSAPFELHEDLEPATSRDPTQPS